MDVFERKMIELRARAGSLTPMEQEAVDTGDAEILVRLCAEDDAKPKHKRKKDKS